MTDREKAIVMAYTGVCMLSGDKLHIFYKYVEDIMGRPVYTHEMAIKTIDDEIKEKSKADFIALCAEQEPKIGHWYYDEDREATGIYAICSNCDEEIYQTGDFKYCPNCGCRMVDPTGAEGSEEE